jgi:hypothetical protein
MAAAAARTPFFEQHKKHLIPSFRNNVKGGLQIDPDHFLKKMDESTCTAPYITSNAWTG